MSDIFSLAKNDYLKGLAVAVFGAVIISVQSAIVHGGLSSIDWNSVLNIALAAGLAYLVKNFVTDSKGNVLGWFGGEK